MISAPDSSASWGQLGHTYLAHGWSSDAAVCYAEAARIQPEAPEWHYLRGRSLELDDLDAAAGAFERTLQILPGYAPARLHYAEVLRKLGRFEEAKSQFHEVTILDPGNPLAEMALGELAFQERDLDAAIHHLERTLQLNPRQYDAHATLAQIYTVQGQVVLAREHELEARKPVRVLASPDRIWKEVANAGVTAPWFAIRGEELLVVEEYERALAVAEEGAAAYPRDLKLRVLRAAALLQLGREEEGLQTLQEARQLLGDADPDEPEDELALRINVGIASYRLGRLREAEESLTEALASDPNAVAALNNLALVRRAQGRPEEATALLEKSLALEWDPRVVQMLKKWDRNGSGSSR